MYSVKTVKKIMDTSINSLIDNFICEPYIHRCEHSIHCELFNMITAHRQLQGLYPLADKYQTALVHKEWPETIPRPEKNNRRGNFDLAILDPEKISKCKLSDFTTGRIEPDFIVEIGLNYDLAHLQNDYTKVLNSLGGSNGGHAYLIHLLQPYKSLSSSDMSNLKAWLTTIAASNHSNIAVAVCVFSAGSSPNPYTVYIP